MANQGAVVVQGQAPVQFDTDEHGHAADQGCQAVTTGAPTFVYVVDEFQA